MLTEQGWLDLLWGPLGSILLVVILGAGKPACPETSLHDILPGSVILTMRAILSLKALCLQTVQVTVQAPTGNATHLTRDRP